MKKAFDHPSVKKGQYTFWENVQAFYHAISTCRGWWLAVCACGCQLVCDLRLESVAVDALCPCSVLHCKTDWTEPLLVGILAFHIVIALTVIATRRRHNLQIALFVAICATVYCAEYINTYCRNNWQSLATQNYFDTNGIFVSTVFSAPLLLLILFQMVTHERLLPGQTPAISPHPHCCPRLATAVRLGHLHAPAHQGQACRADRKIKAAVQGEGGTRWAYRRRR